MKSIKDIRANNYLSAVTVDENASALDAFALMETKDLDYIIVLDKLDCIGIISEIDYLKKVILTGIDPNQIKVKDIMTSGICSVDINESVNRCLELMETFKIRHLIVFENLSPIGVITLHDLMRASFEENTHNTDSQEYFKYAHGSRLFTGQQPFTNIYF